MAAMEAAASIAKRGSITNMTPTQMEETLKKVLDAVKANGYKNIPWPGDFTGLHLAAAKGDAAAVRTLLEASAEVSLDVKDAKRGKTPFDVAWDRHRDPEIMSLLVGKQEAAPIELYKAAKEGGSDDATWDKIFTALRTSHYVTMRSDASEYSLLHWAVRHGKQQAVETLVNEFQADVSEKTDDGFSEDAAAVAKRFEHDKLAEWLRESGCQQVVFKDSEGRTIRIKKTKANTLDLFVDGRHRVAKMTNLQIAGDKLRFEGNKIMFSEDELVSSELTGEVKARLAEMSSEASS